MRMFLLAAAFVLFAPAASAHATAPALDNTLCFTVGSLNEPITTYVKSGLDLHVRTKIDPALTGDGACGSDDRGDYVEGFQSAFTKATIISPSNETMDLMDIRAQHGQVGKYTSARPYHLTEPGQYILRVEGEWAGRPFAGDYKVAGEVGSIETTLFPALDEADTIAGLQAQIAALEARMQTLEGAADHDAPAPGLPVLAAAIGLAAVLRRR